MLSRFAPNDIVPLRQLFIKYDSLLSFWYIWFVKRSLSLIFLRVDGGNNKQSLGCRSFIRFLSSIFCRQQWYSTPGSCYMCKQPVFYWIILWTVWWIMYNDNTNSRDVANFKSSCLKIWCEAEFDPPDRIRCRWRLPWDIPIAGNPSKCVRCCHTQTQQCHGCFLWWDSRRSSRHHRFHAKPFYIS